MSYVIATVVAGAGIKGFRCVKTGIYFNSFIYSKHEVHSMNTHSAERRLMKTDKTERSTRH